MSHCLIIATDDLRFGGMADVARKCADSVDVLAVGAAGFAQELASLGCDAVTGIVVDEGVPAEAAFADVRDAVARIAPNVVLCNDGPAARMLLGAAAGALGACVIDDVADVERQGDAAIVAHRAPNRIALERYEVAGPVACIYAGDDADVAEGSSAAPISEVHCDAPAASISAVVPNEDTGLASADRVVSVGMGVRKESLDAVQAFAAAADAFVACSLPVCNDRHWFPPANVVGSSHNQCSPSLYVAFGISGAPNHISGARDAKTIVAVNTDPDAPIFKAANYGIVGDAAEVAQALQGAIAKLS